MKVVIVSLLAFALAAPAAGAEKAAYKKRQGSSPGRFRVVACSSSGGALSGKIVLTPLADDQEAGDDGVAFDIAPPPGGTPTISAHAINTKGTGATNKGRLADPSTTCSAEPAPGGRMRAAPAPTCSVEESGDDVTATFTLPLSAFGASAKTGHVTLMKRGDAADGASVVAACKSDKPTRASWDLATLKGG